MSWWVGVHDHGNGSAFVFTAPSLADAVSEAHATNSYLYGPFPTQAAADAVEGQVGSGGGSPPPGTGGGNPPPGGGPAPPGQWWIEYIVAPGGSQAVPKVVHAGSAPKAGGSIEWVFGPYETRAAAQAAAAHGPPSGNPVSSRGLTDNSSTSGGGLVPGVSQFFSALSQASTWERAGQVILGLILIAIGLARMTSAVPLATKIAKTAGTAAVL